MFIKGVEKVVLYSSCQNFRPICLAASCHSGERRNPGSSVATFCLGLLDPGFRRGDGRFSWLSSIKRTPDETDILFGNGYNRTKNDVGVGFADISIAGACELSYDPILNA
jgi:hypothetical protein